MVTTSSYDAGHEVTERLTVWLYDTPVMTLSATDTFRLSAQWEPSGIERWGLGSRMLSVSLPLGSPLSSRDNRVLDFFSNLLPDGPSLIAMAQLAGVSPLDIFGLLSVFGSDCAGAIVLLGEGKSPSDPSIWRDEAMTAIDLDNAIENLATIPFGADLEQGWTPSLAGYQGKVLLGRAATGEWTRPSNGAPSTWILKPDREHRLAANEATCLALAQRCGLKVPDVELLEVNDAKVLAIRRYDRDESTSPVSRIHQEDGCQVSGTAPLQKYEFDGGPSLRAISSVVRDYGDVGALEELLRRVTFNVGIGNADAHAKNFSFLHGPSDHSLELAPVYDVLSTIALDQRPGPTGSLVGASTRMGQTVNEMTDVLLVSRADVVAEATRWGLRRSLAQTVVDELLDAMRDTLHSGTGDETALSAIDQQLRRLSRRFTHEAARGV